ncbi:gamma-type small acid-soluble spore protein [Edaphobacillus lindanitolerans]|uniref:gamma-type small acid-soluble spore protein n=1 Tax=Edaphobacillus lindanitolerans TaxID=550447 RepID=UPI0009763B4A
MQREEFGSETDIQQVRKQIRGEEFGSETDVQQVRRQNQKSEQNKQQASFRGNRNNK